MIDDALDDGHDTPEWAETTIALTLATAAGITLGAALTILALTPIVRRLLDH